MYVHTHTHTHIYIYIYIYTHTHTHTHTHTLSLSKMCWVKINPDCVIFLTQPLGHYYSNPTMGQVDPMFWVKLFNSVTGSVKLPKVLGHVDPIEPQNNPLVNHILGQFLLIIYWVNFNPVSKSKQPRYWVKT